jgi:polysaccharide biosynthesis transport protein
MNDRPYTNSGPERATLPVESVRGRQPQVFERQPQGYGPYGDEDTRPFDIFKYLRILTKYKWLIAGVIILVTGLTAVSTFMMTPIYRATASIQIERDVTKIIEKGEVEFEDTSGGEFYQTQYQLLSSRTLAERVSEALRLGDDKAFNIPVSPTLFNLIRAKLTEFISSLIFTETTRRAEEQTAAPPEAKNNKAAVGRLMGGLRIEPVRGSRIVNIYFNHPDPAVAQRIANGYAEVYITDNLDRRFETTAYARKFLEERLQQLKARLEESEKQLVQYADDKGIITLGEGKTVVDSDIEAVNSKLTEARSEKIRLELIWQRVEDAEGLEIAEIRNSETVQANRKLRSELSAQYQQKLNVFKPEYPEMQQLRSQIKELDSQLAQTVKAVKADIKSAYESARITVATLEAEFERGKTALVQQRNRSIQYNILQREVDTNRQLYDGLLQRYKEIGVAGGIGRNNISFVDKAQLPTSPASPDVRRNLLLGLLAGLAIGLLIAFGLDFLDETFRIPEDVEQELGLAVVGVVPLPKGSGGISADLQDQRSAISESFRSLRTSLQFSTPEGLPSSILVTSSLPGEGKSTCAVGLADAFGKMGLKVLLIDADLRKPTLHKRFNLRNDRGLTNYLIGGMHPADTLQVTPLANVFVMTSGPMPPNPAELLSGSRMSDLCSAAREAYDVIIVDGPPIIGLADAPLLAGATQVTLMLVGANSTRKSALRMAVRRIQAVRGNIVGVVLNKFDRREAGYGYGYGYGDYEYYSYGQKQLPSRKT